MKFLTLPALLVAALLSAVVVVPFLPVAKSQTSLFALEVQMASTAPGQIVLYYDTGAGFSENAVTRVNLSKSATSVAYRLPLPPGTYRSFRFDPIDREGTVNISSIRIVGPGGRLIRSLAFRDFKPTQHIQSLRERDGRLELIVTPGTNDPQLIVDFTRPLVVAATFSDLTHGWLTRSAVVFAVLVTLLLAFDFTPRLRARFGSLAASLAARPARAVALIAAFAVLASAYPVVFLGKSHVSPNLGTVLLYDAYPTLPGYSSGETTDVKGADVGAIMWQHVPFSMMQRRALAQGELPLWNRYNAGGVPLLAQGQSMFGDPLHFFVIAAKGAAWAWDVKYLVAKWLFATALGLIVLRLSSSVPPLSFSPSPLLPAALVTLAAPFVGFFIYRVNHPAFFSLCYAPWVLYCWLRVTPADTPADAASSSTPKLPLTPSAPTARWACGLIIANLALMNSGTVKEAYLLLLCLNFSGACVLLSSAAPLRQRLATLAALSWAGLLFVLLTAPIWATFLTTLKTAYTGYNAASAFQIQPGLLLGLFDELFYRPLMAAERTFDPSLNFFLLLGLLYFLATLRHHFTDRVTLALAISSLLPLSLAFGLIPPAWIVQIPFLANIAHLDNTFSCVLIVLWSVLAGVGFATAARRLGSPAGRADLIVAGLLLFALVFAWIAFRQAAHRSLFGPNTTFTTLLPGQTIPVSLFVWATLAAFLAAAVIFALTARRALTRGRLTSAGGLLLTLCTLIFLWRTGLHASAVGFDTYTARPTVRADFHARSEAMEFLRTAQKKEPSRAFGFHGNFHPGWTGAYGLETIHGPDALVNPFMREFITAAIAHPGIERWWDWRLYVDVANAALARPIFDALNVRHYLDLQSDQGVLGQALKIVKGADLDVYESATAWPRAFFTDHLDTYDTPAEFVQKIRTGDGRPFAVAQRPDLTRSPALLSIPRGLVDRTVTAATDYVLTENSTTFTIRAKSAGVIVLNEVFWPGDFRATVNGQKTPVLRLNHTFKGITVDGPGDYRITVRYVPKNWPRNLALCATGAVLLLLSLWIALRRPPRSPPRERRDRPPRMTSATPTCRACGSTQLTLRGKKTGEFIREEFSFHTCCDCELLFVEPFSGFEIYNDAYYRGQGPDPFVDYATEYRDYRCTDRALEFADLARLAESHLAVSPSPPLPLSPSSPSPAPLHWLDFGCGAGGFLKFLRERGTFAGRPLELTGHDVGSYASLLKSTDGFRILDFDEISREPSATYDVISMIEVIEHLPDPASAVALLARLLKPGGLLLLTTGNLDCPVARRHGIYYRYCTPEIHVSLFNPRSLARLYRAHGLEPLPVRYAGTVVFKVVKSLRHRRVFRALAHLALKFPPFVRLVDTLYGVSAMPCAVKPGSGR